MDQESTSQQAIAILSQSPYYLLRVVRCLRLCECLIQVSPHQLHALHSQLSFTQELINLLPILQKLLLIIRTFPLYEAVLVGGNRASKLLVLLDEVVEFRLLELIQDEVFRGALNEKISVEGADESKFLRQLRSMRLVDYKVFMPKIIND
jgi:hypothetical protein